MTFHPYNFISSLTYMVSGMLGIFIVIGIIALITVLLNRITAPRHDDQPK